MKSFAFLFAIAFVAAVQAIELTAEQKAEFRQLNKECRQVSGLSDEDFTNFHNGNVGSIDKDKARKHLICIAKKVHYMNEDGTLNVEQIRRRATEQSASPADVEKIVQCAVQKSTPEETVAHFFKCKHGVVGDININN